ncbi:FkbM family methyltransferase [Stutzerimonas stutzeri]|uniref:FkbM family methyltransferase n=1 Tax=Stutzerimonas stutzeri TaxID=316 RepID=UPI000F746227|nr:FkbM family methyltransferase [Stutzerimonas stutzeri]RRW20048.1 FkbM family methyltransferase [Stutzerimonas stutzeri]
MATTLQENPSNDEQQKGKVVALSIGTKHYSIYLPNAEVDYIQKKISTEIQPYELEMLQDIQANVSAGDLVLDVGANIGNHTLYLAAIAECKVISFEPNASLIEALRRSVQINQLSERVTLMPYGVGHTAGRGHFAALMEENLGGQSIEIGEGDIRIVALDELELPGRVRLIKVDVEGMELPVLQGAAGLIEKDRPLVYVECMNADHYKCISNWMESHGYVYWDTFNATPTHLFRPAESVSLDMRLARLQHHEVLSNYQNAQLLKTTRDNLANANQKYREACQRIDVLKEQMQNSDARQQELKAKLSERQQELEATRQEVQQMRQRLHQAERQYAARLDELASAMAAIAADKTQGQAREHELTAQLDEARRTLQSERARSSLLEKNLAEREQLAAQQIAELAVQRERSAELRTAYDALSEELERYKSRYEEEVRNGQSIRERLEATREQGLESRRQLENVQEAWSSERKVFIEQVAILNQRLDAKAGLLQQREHGVALLEAELDQEREQHEKLIQEHRSATVHIETLEQQLASEREVQKSLESVLASTDAHAAQLQARLDEFHSNDRQHELMERIALLEAELEAAQKVMDALADVESHAAQLQLKLDELLANDKQEELSTRIALLETELDRVVGEGNKLRDELMAEHKQGDEKRRNEHETELANLRRALEQQQAQINTLTQELAKESDKRRIAEQRLIQARASMTYQLGYQLKNARSLGGLVRLPVSLARLYRQAKTQRQSRARQPATIEAPKVFEHAPIDRPAEPEVLADAQQSAALLPQRMAQGQLKIACIMDDFTYGSYQPEAQLQQLTPAGWQSELEDFQPELLFIESAWRGKDELWGSKVGHNASELQQIVRWCRSRGVPTMFWNKEDPVHFETFLTTAKQFDFVFTTDMDCIHRYKAALGHDQVYFLPFACQPSVHNPIELYERKDAFCFAGAYYARYPERTRDLGNFVAKLPEFRPVEIYDRNYGKNDPNYQFPAEYQPFIVGTLPFSEIDRAYKGYRYAINLNSIKQSQTMFARRVYELLGCNTVTVSNYSRGVRLMFGDLVITTDSGEEMVRRLQALAGDEESSGKLRLAALRKVMLEHTYEQRLNYIVAKVSGTPVANPLPDVAVLSYARSEEDLKAVLANFQRQTHTSSILYLVLGRKVQQPSGKDTRVHFLRRKELEGKCIGDIIGNAELLAGMVAEDYYGPNYLLDMAIATRYSSANAFGKVTRYHWVGNECELLEAGRTYHKAGSLQLRSAVARSYLFAEFDCFEWCRALPSSRYGEGSMLAIDPFNYCEGGGSSDEPEAVQRKVDDLALHTGFNIKDLQARAEAIAPAERADGGVQQIPLQQVQTIFGLCRSKDVAFQMEEHGWLVTSTLEDGKHEYIYAAKDLTPEELGGKEQLKFFLEVTPGLNLQLVMLFLDAQKQRIDHVMLPANRNHTFDMPPETAWVRMGWRVYSPGTAEVKAILLGHRDVLPADLISNKQYLVLTNNYPSYHNLYRNGFVHSRVKSYAKQGVNVDVLCFREKEKLEFREFEGQEVLTGDAAVLEKMLASGRYKSVLVHFMSPAMWDVLKYHIDRVRVVCWLHGAEIHPWHRRAFNYTNDAQLQMAKLESEKRMAFWNNVLKPMHSNLHLVIVSQTFAQEIMDDMGVVFDRHQYTVIHNPIDTEVFNYVEKSEEQRKKILSIRPFASRQYANDVSVQAIIELSKKEFFRELEFRIIGDGMLFDETLEPLRQFDNVTIEQRFLTHNQISKLHKEYGVFLCPTRWDSQGVSRDEAMASGLVPVTNAVAAIPEFADESCAILAPEDDSVAIAEGIARLVGNPQLFSTMSKAAVSRVEQKTASILIIEQEIDFFWLG